jgi:cell division protein FtsL
MVRLNMFLLLIVVVCALGVVTSQHRARKLFQSLEGEQERVRQLDVEYGQLQLEMSTWATHPRVEKIARDRLHMVTPDATGRVVAPVVVVALRKALCCSWRCRAGVRAQLACC